MLCQFTFQNYKSFKQEATLDLFAERISEHPESLIVDKFDKESFLPAIVIYGPNGGGKSTVLEAMGYLSFLVLSPILMLKVIPSSKSNNIKGTVLAKLENGSLKDKHYKFDEKYKDIPTKVGVLFRVESNEYKYEISMLCSEIVEENLYIKNLETETIDIIFERNSSDFYLGKSLDGITVEKIKPSMPLLSHISISFENELIDNVVDWFLSHQVLDYDNPMADKRIFFPRQKKNKEIFFNMLLEMDINIVDFRVVKDSEGNIIDIYTKHQLPDGSTHELLFEEESSGTRKLFGLIPYVLECLEEGSLFIADEMDAKLHPKLLKYIISLFTNPNINRNGAQLIFTSHDMSTMKLEVFRRDEIWFCAINKEHSSKLYSLIDFKKENGLKPRNDECYDKQYIEGRYGADPYLKKILDWGSIL